MYHFKDRAVKWVLLAYFWKAPSSMLPRWCCLWEKAELGEEAWHCFAPWVPAEKPLLTPSGAVCITWGGLLCLRRGVTLHPSLAGTPLETAGILNCDLKDCSHCGLWEWPAETAWLTCCSWKGDRITPRVCSLLSYHLPPPQIHWTIYLVWGDVGQWWCLPGSCPESQHWRGVWSL